MKYTYQAEVLRVVDGDTIDVILDLGLNIKSTQRLRLARINAWEPKGEEREKGLKATSALNTLINGSSVKVETLKDSRGKYGRYLAEIWIGNVNVNDIMVYEGHARYVDY